jgi:DNA-binding beta-propeller fold protein YncE
VLIGNLLSLLLRGRRLRSEGSDPGPRGVAVTADGKSAYVTNQDDATVSEYNIDPQTGALSPKTPEAVAGAGVGAQDVAVTPDGRSAYVVNGGTVAQFNIDPVSGVLSPKTSAPVAGGGDIAVTPDGKHAYAIVPTVSPPPFPGPMPGRVLQYDIDPTSGALSLKTPASLATGLVPTSVAVAPDGKSIYVTNRRDSTVSQYTIDAVSGALSPKTPATVASGSAPIAVAVSPDSSSAYVADASFDGTISQYDIDAASGGLSPKSPATVVTGDGAVDIAVSPLQRVHSTGTSVSCSPSTFAPGDATVCRATVTDTAASGQTTPRDNRDTRSGVARPLHRRAARYRRAALRMSGGGRAAQHRLQTP